ncbi:hypothetical protein DTO013E5_7808 [Penicillium roqueforti]|nr:hypothetical protein LCP963914a_6748 [Penicillium roqueforti]KAI2737203.1 hypothetical protein DTO012A1_7831 [Penicillium roqueforti]KAI2749423.1 hypothetical protein DTO013F2_5484 [Penicillium roqueforti]KAI2766513.1 hypothetical protein DTO012A8_8270 [Penicillium roqueforti]KAI3068325.1 hypothetical protein CBS147339_8253 [Penicillium roqueforti]
MTVPADHDRNRAGDGAIWFNGRTCSSSVGWNVTQPLRVAFEETCDSGIYSTDEASSIRTKVSLLWFLSLPMTAGRKPVINMEFSEPTSSAMQ